MYILYWNPRSSSQAPMAVLDELGLDYRLQLVDMEAGECDTPEYRAIQPLGLVPALGLPGGGSMFESAAIVQYLADNHGDGALAPLQQSTGRAQYLQWMHYLSGTIYPTYNRYFWPAHYSATSAGRDEIRSHVAGIVLSQWQVIEDALQRAGPWLLGQTFSTADIYLQMMTTWHRDPADLLARFPCIRKLAQAIMARKACRRANELHGFDSGLLKSPEIPATRIY